MSVYQEGHMGGNLGMSYGKYRDGHVRKDKKPKEKVKYQITVHYGEVEKSVDCLVKVCKAKRRDGGSGVRSKTLMETPVHYNTTKPTWDYTDTIEFKKDVGSDSFVKVELRDRDRVRSDEIGAVIVHLTDMGSYEKMEFTTPEKDGKLRVVGSVTISFKRIRI